MSMIWRDSLFLLKRDLMNDWKFFLWNLLFMGYAGGCIGLLFHSLEEGDSIRTMSGLLDFMFLVMIPLTGFWFCRTSFRYLRDDSYTQRLLYFKTLPIPLNAVIISRIMQGLCATAINGIILYPVIYFLSSGLNNSVSAAGYIPFVLTWTGYSLLVNSYYLYFEFLSSGRFYLWMTFVYMGISGVITAVIIISGGSLMEFIIDNSEGYGYLSPVMWVSLAAGGLVLYVAARIVYRKLERRDMV